MTAMDKIIISIGKLVTSVAFVDLLVCFLLTVPVFLAYVITVIVYFKKSDKPVDTKTHGLSRFTLGGVLLIFGMIIVNMNIEFISAMFVSLHKYNKLDTLELETMFFSVVFLNFIEHYRAIPFEILIMGNIVCAALYASAEGLISSFKTLSIPAGLCIELPYNKKKRMKFIFLIWCAIAILASIYTIIIGSDEIKFEVSLCYTGVISTLIILILSDRAPTILQNFSTNKDTVEKVNISSSVFDGSENTIDNANDPIDRVTDAAVKVLKKLNPAFSENNIEIETSGGDL